MKDEPTPSNALLAYVEHHRATHLMPKPIVIAIAMAKGWRIHPPLPNGHSK